MGVGIYNRGSFQNHSNSSLHGQLTNGIQNGVSIACSYDSLARPTGYRPQSCSSCHPVEINYAYDVLGRFASVVPFAP